MRRGAARVRRAALVLAAAVPLATAGGPQTVAPPGAAVTPAAPGAAIDDLGRLDDHARMIAARTVTEALIQGLEF